MDMLTQQEREILTLADDARVRDFVEYAHRFVSYPADEIEQTAKKLCKEGYIEIIDQPSEDGEEGWYFHTKKAQGHCVDELAHRVEVGAPSRHSE